MSDTIVHTTDASFEADVLQSNYQHWLIFGRLGAAHAK